MSFGVVIAAAGQGTRMNAQISKQYLKLSNRPILAHTISLFENHPQIDQIVVVVADNEIDYCQREIIDPFFNSSNSSVKLVAGGKTRRQSVFAGLKAFSPAINYVLIHDGVRPLLPVKLIDKIIGELKKHPAVTLGISLRDTVKRVDNNFFVKETPPRSELVAIQTPQGFNYNLILKAHETVSEDIKVTDDVSLVEKLNQPVRVIQGSQENIKITTPLDLTIAESILKKREL